MVSQRSFADRGTSFKIDTLLSKFSTRLLSLVASGQQLSKVSVARYRAQRGNVLLSEKFELSNVTFDSMSQSSRIDDAIVPLETYLLRFEKFQFSQPDRYEVRQTANYDYLQDQVSGTFGALSLPSDARPNGLSLYLSGVSGGEEVSTFSLDVNEMLLGGQPKAVARLASTAAVSRFLGDWYANKTFDTVRIAQTIRGHVKTQWQLNSAKISQVSLELSPDNQPAVLVEFAFDSLDTSETQLDRSGNPTTPLISKIDVANKRVSGVSLSTSDLAGPGRRC